MDKKIKKEIQNQYDMSAWFIEKQTHVISALSRMNFTLQNSNIEYELKDTFQAEIRAALYDATKVLSYACDREWSPEDRDLLMENPEHGVEELLRRYGQKSNSHLLRKREGINNFLEKMSEYLDGDRSNRTLMYEIVYPLVKYKIGIINDIYEQLENVTNNNLPWDTFVKYCKDRENELLELKETCHKF